MLKAVDFSAFFINYEFYGQANDKHTEFVIAHKNKNFFNPFLVHVSILYSLKTPGNQKLSGILRGYKMGTLARNRLNHLERLA